MTNVKIYPKKLKQASHVRVIAPSRSLGIISDAVVALATQRLGELGIRISFGRHATERDTFSSSSIESRLRDLHDAFADKTVDAIFTAIGGYNAIQLLDQIDYELIRDNPKIMCGFSDITVLSNAIFAMTGLVSYSGPHFSSWGMEKGFDYSAEAVQKCFFSDDPYELQASAEWSDDPWFMDQDKRLFRKNAGLRSVNDGEASGTIVGGHVRCLSALQGTRYWPSLENTILFLEEDEETNAPLFDRLLQSLIYQKDFSGVKGVVIGRFQNNSNISQDMLVDIIKNKPALSRLPVVIGADFGHTTPTTVFPIGGECSLVVYGPLPSIKIIKH